MTLAIRCTPKNKYGERELKKILCRPPKYRKGKLLTGCDRWEDCEEECKIDLSNELLIQALSRIIL
jgi:hypothetical protein